VVLTVDRAMLSAMGGFDAERLDNLNDPAFQRQVQDQLRGMGQPG
jgi:hypothetical protein